MAVAEILEHVPLVGLGKIVPAGAVDRRIGRDDRRARFQVQRHVTLQMNGVRKIVACREGHRPSTSGRGCIDGLVNGGGVDGFSVAGGAEGPYVKAPGGGGVWGGVRHALVCRDGYRGAGHARTGKPQKVPA